MYSLTVFVSARMTAPSVTMGAVSQEWIFLSSCGVRGEEWLWTVGE